VLLNARGIGRALLRPPRRLATIDHPATSLGPRCAIATSTATIRARRPSDHRPSRTFPVDHRTIDHRLNRPGGNVTGVNIIFGALGAKRLELLHDLVPAAGAIGMLVNPAYPSAPIEVQDVEAAGRKLGLRMHILDARTENDIDPAFGDFAEKKVKGLLVADDPFFQGQRLRIVGLAGRRGLPAIYFSRDFVDAGGLMSYGPNLVDVYRVVGVYCGRILKGEKPADLPVVQPTRFELVINLKTARALGLDVPPTLLALADEVIE